MTTAQIKANNKKWERAIVLFNRNLPTHSHKTSLRAFVSWIAGMTCRMLCVYSIGAGLISREKHYNPLLLYYAHV